MKLPQPIPMNGTMDANRRRKRLKIDVACDPCRTKKIKCDGARPVCNKCAARFGQSGQCHYTTTKASPRPSAPNRPRNSSSLPQLNSSRDPAVPVDIRPHLVSSSSKNEFTGPNYTQKHVLQTNTAVPAAQLTPNPSPSNAIAAQDPATVDSMNAIVDGPSTEYFGGSSAGSFTSQIKAALEGRLRGQHADSERNHRLRASYRSSTSNGRASDVGRQALPPRRLADEMMEIYWKLIAPLYPFLNRRHWDECYSNIFAGIPIDRDESLFISTMNIIFALSTQLMEHVDRHKRDQASSVYFERAREPLDLVLWDSGSLGLVQYLLLTGQYLQCTSSPHLTWMVVGSAARIAQSLGLHLTATSDTEPSLEQRELHRRIWHGCVLMDRMVSLTHGRPAMVSAELAASVPLPCTSSEMDSLQGLGDATFFVKSVELYEITHELTEKLYHGMPRLTKHTSVSSPSELATVVQIDGRLTEWQVNIPGHLSMQHPMPSREGVILYMRFLHARTLLLRPSLALVCLPKPEPESTFSDSDLTSRIHQQCAEVCVKTAQATISLLLKYQASDGTVGLLPAWWYRLYYLFSASMVLITAKLRPDVFPVEEINTSWNQAMRVCGALQELSVSANNCIEALNILSSKILSASKKETSSASVPMQPDITDGSFSGSRDIGFDNDPGSVFSDIAIGDFALEPDDLSWLNYMTTWNSLIE